MMGLHYYYYYGYLQALPLLAWILPLMTFASFTDETLERVAKSEGYCSRILRAQGTRREGYNEFSLRVEGDPEFYKPGNSYRGKSLHFQRIRVIMSPASAGELKGGYSGLQRSGSFCNLLPHVVCLGDATPPHRVQHLFSFFRIPLVVKKRGFGHWVKDSLCCVAAMHLL